MRIITYKERTVIMIFSSLLILGLAVKTVKDNYYTGIDNLILIDTNNEVIDFYAQLDEKDIEFAGMVDINSAEIEELISTYSYKLIRNKYYA